MYEPQEVDILLVEDSINDVELTRRALQKPGLTNRLFVVRDGEEALEFVFAKGRYAGRDFRTQPKVVLLDLKLPKVDGLQVLREIKSDDRTKSIPVVVVTSSQENSDIKEAYRLGANSYIIKPVDFDAFAKALSELAMYWALLNKPLQ
jgi:CheY-like chemotaxis protein